MRVAQGGFDRNRLVRRQQPTLASKLLHQADRALRGVEFPLRGVEVQDALGPLVVLDARLAAQRLQGVAAVGAQADDLADVVARACGQAFAQEAQPPQPLQPVRPQPEQQRRVLAQHPLQRLPRCGRVGPGFGVADRNLSAVGEAGFGAGEGLAVDHRDLAAEAVEIVGAGGTDDSRAQNDDSHACIPVYGVEAASHPVRMPAAAPTVPGT